MIAKHEKRLDWTKLTLVNLFENNNTFKTYKQLLGDLKVKVFVNEVSRFLSNSNFVFAERLHPLQVPALD